MRYHDITKDDMKNGDGLRVVLWMSGCSHHCPDCQNPVTWDPMDGLPFDADALLEIEEQLQKDYDAKQEELKKAGINGFRILRIVLGTKRLPIYPSR